MLKQNSESVRRAKAKAIRKAAGLTAETLRVDPQNANLGTARGMALLDESLETCGAGRSITIDKHGVVIAGNKTLEAARRRGMPIQVVQTRGDELVVVQRTDLDLIEDPKARQLAYYDNRVRELGIAWSPDQLKADLLAGVDLGCAFFPEEIDVLTRATVAAVAAAVESTPQMAENPAQADTGEPAAEPVASEPTETPRASYATYVLTFETIEQQLKWSAFSRALRERYQDVLTAGARLLMHINSVESEVQV